MKGYQKYDPRFAKGIITLTFIDLGFSISYFRVVFYPTKPPQMNLNPLTEKAFEKLFKAYFRPLTVYAMQFVGDQEKAEDLVQDLFLHIYEKRASLRNVELNNHYLYRAIHNRCLNNISYQKLRSDNNPQLQEGLNSKPENPLEIVEGIEFENKLLEGLESLSPQCRKVFEMSRIDGKKNLEIAQELSLSKRTIESHISQALKILRKKLWKYLPILGLLGLILEVAIIILTACNMYFSCYLFENI